MSLQEETREQKFSLKVPYFKNLYQKHFFKYFLKILRQDIHTHTEREKFLIPRRNS